MADPIHVISLGAGVQSSTMALMAAQGKISPMPDCAIFADTGAESAATYKQVDYLITRLPFPVHVVSGGNLLGDLLNGNKRASNGRPPFFVKTDDGPAGRLGKHKMRFKNFAWDQALPRRRANLISFGRWHVPPPDALIDLNARLFLEAYYRGPWRMISALIKHELRSVWMHYGFFKWEWIRTRIFRRPPDATLAEAQRTWDEMDAVEELAREL